MRDALAEVLVKICDKGKHIGKRNASLLESHARIENLPSTFSQKGEAALIFQKCRAIFTSAHLSTPSTCCSDELILIHSTLYRLETSRYCAQRLKGIIAQGYISSHILPRKIVHLPR